MYETIITDMGNKIIAAAVTTNEKVNIKYIAVGDGGGQQVQLAATQLKLVNEKVRITPTKYTVDGNIISVTGTVTTDEESFVAREVGLIDSDDNLIAVGSVPEFEINYDLGITSTYELCIKIIVENTNVINFTLVDSFDSELSTTSANAVQNKVIAAKINELEQEISANKITVDNDLDDMSTNPVQNCVIDAALAKKSSTNHIHSTTTSNSDGFMSSEDKIKIDNMLLSSGTYTASSISEGTFVKIAEMPVDAFVGADIYIRSSKATGSITVGRVDKFTLMYTTTDFTFSQVATSDNSSAYIINYIYFMLSNDTINICVKLSPYVDGTALQNVEIHTGIINALGDSLKIVTPIAIDTTEMTILYGYSYASE